MHQERVKELFTYNPSTGELTWNCKRGRAKTGQAGTPDPRGHRIVCVDNRRVAATRLIWLYMTGEMPRAPISFVDGDPQNLRWDNLETHAAPEQPNAENIRRLFHYDPDTGALTRLQTTSHRARKGVPAGTISAGYLNVSIDKVTYKGHRLIWLYMTGEWPLAEIDHRDGNPGNNRWCNLREADSSQNKCNRSYANRTGYRGVHQTARGMFAAEVTKDGVRHKLGTFPTAAQAGEAAAAKRAELHGAFARP